MSEYGSYPGDMVAGCRVAGAAPSGIQGQPLRVLSAVRGGVGVYLVTLTADCGVDSLDAIVVATPRTATFAVATAVQLSDTTVGVTTWDAAGAPLDADFHLGVWRTAVGA